MFEGIVKFFKKLGKSEKKDDSKSKDTAKERLHLVLMQDRANVSADFLEMMKQEIIEVIKKYIDVDEKAIDVKLTNKMNDDGTVGAPALYANIPIVTLKEETRKFSNEDIAKTSNKHDDESKNEIKEKTEEKPEQKENIVIDVKEGNTDKIVKEDVVEKVNENIDKKEEESEPIEEKEKDADIEVTKQEENKNNK